ncbi:MAG: LamG-like jellyroll fold domain-containing protein, partial [Planctomycetota bacterium]
QLVVVTFDSSEPEPTFYHNGIKQTSSEDINALPDELSDALYIGKWGGEDSNSYFDGEIDDVRIFNRVLGPNEVNQLYYRDSAFWPTPTDDQQNVDPNEDPIFYWRVGTLVEYGELDSHFRLYFGSSDPPDDANWPCIRPLRKISEWWLDPNETYYWRVDTEKYNGQIVTGRVWSFKTKP